MESRRPAPYWLARHVHLGLCDRHAVLMDVRRNCYVAVQPVDALAGWVAGWPGSEAGTTGRRADPPVVLARLLEHGALVREAADGHPATAVQALEPERTLLEFDFDRPPAPKPSDVWRMACAWAMARLALKCMPMHVVLARVRARRMSTAIDWPQARLLVRTFWHLRPLFYTARDACLLDSLTLINFLAFQGLYPRWMFGVRTAPFRAHCWVQSDTVLFNDLPDRVRQFTPILEV